MTLKMAAKAMKLLVPEKVMPKGVPGSECRSVDILVSLGSWTDSDLNSAATERDRARVRE
jgi:hypothetical protein